MFGIDLRNVAISFLISAAIYPVVLLGVWGLIALGTLATDRHMPADTMPLVYESFDWEHGVFVGASMRSNATSAAEQTGAVLAADLHGRARGLGGLRIEVFFCTAITLLMPARCRI